MKFHVNDGCIGCGMCNGMCPAIFSMNDEGTAQAIDGEVNASDIADAEEAMNSCPAGVIEKE